MILCLLPLFGSAAAAGELRVPILVYHRFGPFVADSMTVRTETFADALLLFERRGVRVIPLRELVDFLLRGGPAPPDHAIVVTVDDGHRSVRTEMLPLVLEHRVPVTLFVYPSAISRAEYALTWDELRELRSTGLVDVQSHTWWHPDFRKEARRLGADEYARFVDRQLLRSREILATELGLTPDLLAWPFGIHDPDLAARARTAGYVAGFTLERRHAREGDDPMALPRYLMTDLDRGTRLERLVGIPGDGLPSP